MMSAIAVLVAQALAALPSGSERHGASGASETDHGATAPLVPSEWQLESPDYWAVGVAFELAERFVREDSDFSDQSIGSQYIDDRLFGLSVAYRNGAWGPHARLLVSPNFLGVSGGNTTGVENTQLLYGMGLRAHAHALGTELTYGVGAHVEMRLADHYWIASATPAEIGALVLASGSWRLETFFGVRHLFAGSLINHFIVDPNGFDNEGAQAELDTLKDDSPWQGYASIVFSRKF